MKESNFEKNLNPQEAGPDPSVTLSLFREASGASQENAEALNRLASKINELPDDSFEAAKQVRKFLVDSGFRYDNDFFTLQDIMKNKKGNCLGLALLFGSILSERGFSPKYEMILNPKDAVYDQELKLFESLMGGQYFQYDEPILPALSEQAEHPLYRFAPLEHPALVLDDERVFETTGLEDTQEDPEWIPKAEVRRPATVEEIASHVYTDRIKSQNENLDLQSIQEQCEAAIALYPNNREAYSILWDLADEIKDKNLKQKAFEQYQRINGDDSRFHFRVYQMTGDIAHLDRALELAPMYLPAFMIRNVELQEDPREAKFNFAVAAWCAANAITANLKDFYKIHGDQLERLYGKEAFREIQDQ